jgi:hypothetical protein
MLKTLMLLLSFVWKDHFFDSRNDCFLGCVRMIESRKMRLMGCVACMGGEEMQTRFGRKTRIKRNQCVDGSVI